MSEYYTANEVNAILLKCRNHIKREEYISAFRTVNQAINNSKLPEFYTERANCFNVTKRFNYSLKDSKTALKILKKEKDKADKEDGIQLYKIEQKIACVYYQVTKSFYGKNNTKKAKEMVKKGLKISPKNQSLLRLQRVINCEEIELTERQIIQLKETFFYFDKTFRGFVTHKDVKNVMHEMGCKLSNSEVKKIFQSFDENDDGIIDFGEFVTIMVDELKNSNIEKELKLAYTAMDVDGDGNIDLEELKKGFAMLEEYEVLENFENFCKKRGLNEIKFEDFVRCFMV